MPYSHDFAGIYKIVNTATGKCYVGQSRRIKKRLASHASLLRRNLHPNAKLQNSYNRYGKEFFEYSVEIYVDNPEDLDALEMAFLRGDAWFDEEVFFNISMDAPAGMTGRRHTPETRAKISEKKKGDKRHVTGEYRRKLSDAQRRRLFSNREFVNTIRYIIENEHLSYAERGRRIGLDTSSVRKKAIKYKHLRGII